MAKKAQSPLLAVESRMRTLIPANLYAATWINPTTENLTHVFEHLRTLQRILRDYVPREVADSVPHPGEVRYRWQEGALMFTDLAGFTPLLEANAALGPAGAASLLGVLNEYFAAIIEVVSKSGGNLLEFTGDAILVEFPASRQGSDVVQAVRAGMRMQRAMARFAEIETPDGVLSLGMRIGVHCGRFLAADVGTPRRMEHVLLGHDVRTAKLAEGAGEVGYVNLTQAAYERVQDEFRCKPGKPGYMLVVDDFSEEQLGEYDISLTRRRLSSPVLFDSSVEGIIKEISAALDSVEPLASYLPTPVLNVVVESAADRQIQPEFPELIVIFVNLLGVPDAADRMSEGEEPVLLNYFSHVFTLISAAVESQGGVLKHVTYHLSGSDMLIYFGAPNAHIDDVHRAAAATLNIRSIINTLQPPSIAGEPVHPACQIGMAKGPAFLAEVGEPRGRREFNILGDTVNTAARLMGKAEHNQILLTQPLYEAIKDVFEAESMGALALKGKAEPMPVYALLSPRGPAE